MSIFFRNMEPLRILLSVAMFPYKNIVSCFVHSCLKYWFCLLLKNSILNALRAFRNQHDKERGFLAPDKAFFFFFQLQ